MPMGSVLPHDPIDTVYSPPAGAAVFAAGAMGGRVRARRKATGMTYQQHPLSAAFPVMAPNEFVDLKDSIEIIGLQNPITLFEGMVLDGWNRYKACSELGMACKTVELGNVDPRDFVMAQNKARRHVTQAQLAMATTAVYAWKPLGANQHGASALNAEPTKSTKELAEVAGVGVRSIEQAKAVQTKAAPEVVEAVKSGEIGLPKAAAIAQLPKEDQAAAINKPVSQIKPKAAPAPEPEPTEEIPEDDAPSDEEIALQLAEEEADRKRVELILESDDVVASLTEENKRLHAQIIPMQLRINGLLNEKAAAIDTAKKEQRRADRLQREVDKLKSQGFEVLA